MARRVYEQSLAICRFEAVWRPPVGRRNGVPDFTSRGQAASCTPVIVTAAVAAASLVTRRIPRRQSEPNSRITIALLVFAASCWRLLERALPQRGQRLAHLPDRAASCCKLPRVVARKRQEKGKVVAGGSEIDLGRTRADLIASSATTGPDHRLHGRSCRPIEAIVDTRELRLSDARTAGNLEIGREVHAVVPAKPVPLRQVAGLSTDRRGDIDCQVPRPVRVECAGRGPYASI